MKKQGILILLAILIIFGLYLVGKNEESINLEPNGRDQNACTEEAKICPDGSSVGRGGPNCEFAACPEVTVTYRDLIKVSTPTKNSLVSSPLVVKGEARGNWYFEASFPVKLLDANGKQLAIVPAQAIGEWMTTEFVPFEATLTFPKPTTSTGTLVLEKDNPSGEPQFDDSVSFPVIFTQ